MLNKQKVQLKSTAELKIEQKSQYSPIKAEEQGMPCFHTKNKRNQISFTKSPLFSSSHQRNAYNFFLNEQSRPQISLWSPVQQTIKKQDGIKNQQNQGNNKQMLCFTKSKKNESEISKLLCFLPNKKNSKNLVYDESKGTVIPIFNCKHCDKRFLNASSLGGHVTKCPKIYEHRLKRINRKICKEKQKQNQQSQ